MLLPPRPKDDVGAARLQAKLEEHAEQMLAAVDEFSRLRSAPGDTKRMRQNMRTDLERAITSGVSAYLWSIATTEKDANHGH